MQGERDMQVSVSDAEHLKEAAPHAKLVLLPSANHILKVVNSTDRAANMVAYAKPNLPLAPGVVDGIAGFIRTVPAACWIAPPKRAYSSADGSARYLRRGKQSRAVRPSKASLELFHRRRHISFILG